MPAVSIRQTTCADHETLRALRLKMLAGEPRAFDASLEQALEQPQEHWAAWAGSTGPWAHAAVWLAEVGGVAVGMAAAQVQDPTAAIVVVRVGSMWVDPNVRRGGVAKALLAAVESWAAGVGAGTLELGVISGNTRALELYLQLGFAPNGKTVMTCWGLHAEDLEKRL